MAYGDKIDFGKIKDSRLFYKKPSERSFNQNWIQFNIINSNNWCYTLEFENRKEWFKCIKLFFSWEDDIRCVAVE